MWAGESWTEAMDSDPLLTDGAVLGEPYTSARSRELSGGPSCTVPFEKIVISFHLPLGR
jgi:hypothetical protein